MQINGEGVTENRVFNSVFLGQDQPAQTTAK